MALLLVGCVERDNPFDPVNRQVTYRAKDTFFLPIPRLYNLVVFPESAGANRSGPYFGNIQAALAQVRAGDTLWIHGGEKFYPVYGGLTMRYGGSDLMPIVVRSFGGAAMIRFDTTVGTKVGNCLGITQPYVKIVGFIFMNCQTGIVASSLNGPITLDSIQIQNSQVALDIQQVKGLVKLHHVTMTSNVAAPPYIFAENDSIDTLDFKWTPRVGGGI